MLKKYFWLSQNFWIDINPLWNLLLSFETMSYSFFYIDTADPKNMFDSKGVKIDPNFILLEIKSKSVYNSNKCFAMFFAISSVKMTF